MLLWSMLAACSVPAPSTAALDQTWISAPEPAALRSITLEDHAGTPVAAEFFVGRTTLVALGYTSCPDVCPTTLQGMARALSSLEADGVAAQGVFVGVDEQRDRPALATYVTHFHDEITGMTGDSESLRVFADRLGGAFDVSSGPDGVQVNHSTSVFVVDATARVVGYALRPADGDQLAHDVEAILADNPRPVELVDGWVRRPPGTVRMTAGYGTLINRGPGALTLAHVTSPRAASVDVHETYVVNGLSSMRPATISLDPGEREALAPGGTHLMIFDVDADAATIPFLLTFEGGSDAWVTAKIGEPG